MRNPVYEQALERQGLAFSYVEKVDLTEIDRQRSLRNQARLTAPADEELVSAYEASYRAKQQFPPLVVWRPSPRGRYVLVDGNQRLAACDRAGVKRHDCYVIEIADQQVVDRVTWTFNNHVNGKRLSEAECLEHAVSFVRKYGLDQKAAAEQWGVSRWKVREKIVSLRVREVLGRHDVKVPAALAENTLRRLSPLLDAGEDLLVEAVKTAGAALVEDTAQELVAKVGKARTQAEKVAAVREFAASDLARDLKAETKNGEIRRQTPQPRERLARLVREANALFENFPDKAALKPRASEYKAQRQAAYDLVDRLALLFGLGAAHKEAATA